MLLITLSCFLFSVIGLSVTQDEFKVKTTEGNVIGAKASDGDYVAFYGIPYAGSVSGENRFKAPPAPPKHSVDLKAVDSGIVCAQPSPHGLVGVENCLTLNIFTRNFTSPKPVIVWINGEEFSRTNDTPQYSFRSLVLADVVLIALNYRLSIFGFLCLGVEEAPGNAGLKDVVQALKWIKENVAGFGGDPNNVMLVGHGTGGAMVDLMTMSPLSKGLFHKAVALSGSAFSPWAVAYDPAGYAKALGAKLQYTDKTNAELARLLKTTDSAVLANEINGFTFTNNTVLFAPCVENTKLKGSFLEDNPLKVIQSKSYHQIPFIASYVNREGTIRVSEAVYGNWLKMMQNEFGAFLPAYLAFKDEASRKNVSQKVRESYFGDTKDISEPNNVNLRDFIAYQGDSLITVPVIRGVQERAKSGSGDVRLLEFTYKDDNFDWPYPNVPLDGVKHGDILDYIFDRDTRSVSRNTKESLVARLVAYARTGKPEGITAWLSYTNEESYYLRISGFSSGSDGRPPEFNEEVRIRPHEDAVSLWQKTLSEYYSVPQRVSSAGMPVTSSLVIIVSLIMLRLC